MYQITLNIDGMMWRHVREPRQRRGAQCVSGQEGHVLAQPGRDVILSETAIPEAELRPVFTKLGYALTGYACVPYEKKGLFRRH